MARSKRKVEVENRAGGGGGGGSEEKPAKRKRKRKARTDVSSSSEDDSSSNSESESESEVKRVLEDEVPMATPMVEDDEDGDEEDGDEEDGDKEGGARGFTEKGGRIPSPLRDLHDPQAAAKFEEYYMRVITEEFGDDLNALRQAKDFGDRSLPMLVRALKQGVDIFDAAEKRIVVGGGVSGIE